MPLTKTQQSLLEEMKAALDEATWERVPAAIGFTIRYTETRITPEGIPQRWWPGETYERHQFLSLHHRGVIYGDAPAPWVGRNDSHITYKRAFAILRDPAARWEPRPAIPRGERTRCAVCRLNGCGPKWLVPRVFGLAPTAGRSSLRGPWTAQRSRARLDGHGQAATRSAPPSL